MLERLEPRGAEKEKAKGCRETRERAKPAASNDEKKERPPKIQPGATPRVDEVRRRAGHATEQCDRGRQQRWVPAHFTRVGVIAPPIPVEQGVGRTQVAIKI